MSLLTFARMLSIVVPLDETAAWAYAGCSATFPIVTMKRPAMTNALAVRRAEIGSSFLTCCVCCWFIALLT